MGTYGQFCLVAKALELLDERWTVLVIRELPSGSRHFNKVRRAYPGCHRHCWFSALATVDAELRSLVKVWRGDLSRREATRAAGLEVIGPTAVRRAMPRWLGRSSVATVPRSRRLIREFGSDTPGDTPTNSLINRWWSGVGWRG